MAICCVSQVMRWRGISRFCGAVFFLFLILCFAFAALIEQMTGQMQASWWYLVIGADWYAAVCVSGVCREVEPTDRHAPTIPPASVLVFFFFSIILQHDLLAFTAWFENCNNQF